MTAAGIEATGVSQHFGGVRAVDDVSLVIRPGLLTSVIGPNGAGKSTLLDLLAGTRRPTRGTISYDGTDITRWSDRRRARAGIARTFQAARVLHRMAVLDNVMLAADQPGDRLAAVLARPLLSRTRDHDVRGRALQVLDELGLVSLADDYASSLSGGQRKLLEFARLMMAQPRLVLLDEPLAGVSPAMRERLLERVIGLRDTGDLTFVLVEHDLPAVMRHSDRVMVMASGRLLTEGTPDEVRSDPRVIDAYLGTSAPPAEGVAPVEEQT